MGILVSDWSYAANSRRFSRTLCVGTVWLVSLTTFFSLWWHGESLSYFCDSNAIGKCNTDKIQLFLRACSSVKWWMLIYRLLIFPLPPPRPPENCKFFCPLWSLGIMHGTAVSGVYWVLLELTTTLSYLVFFFSVFRQVIDLYQM